MPVVLLAQGGGHSHTLSVGVSIGPTVLRIALLAAIPVIAGFALLRGFLAEPGRRSLAGVIMAAGVVATLELLLSGGLNLSQRLVPLLLALLALPLYLVLSRDERFRPAVDRARRYAPWVFWPAAALAAWQFVLAWFAGAGTARTATLLHTGVLLAVVALAWFVITRTRRAASTMSVRFGAAALAMGLIASGAQAMVLRPAGTVPGVAVAAEVDTGDGVVDVLVVPNLPGWNLVRVTEAGVAVAAVGGDFVPAVARPGATGAWAAVELPAGPGEVRVRRGGGTGSLTVDTGTGDPAPALLAGPDGTECAAALLGRALGTDAPVPDGFRCPAGALSDADADALRDVVAAVAAQGHRWLTVAGDDSPRGRAATEVVHAAAAAWRLEVRPPAAVAARPGPMVIVSGWTAAATTLRTRPHATVHTAPWLAMEPPRAPGFGDYGTDLRERFPGVEPSVSGYRAWREARAGAAPDDRAAP
ncbi:DUF6239 family natural product biosynthesis protein [Actinophytocola glycyrrhizae]|uniref:DUF6239 family natural product biosynthesis protein n=1 Tax=Actinophytocola glycyrrhizae TaxID=2044873 RepID=A0ABV9S5L5_9PSEU